MGVQKEIKEPTNRNIRPLEEKQWVREIREKSDRDAFEKLFRAYYQRLYHFAYGFVGQESAEDVVQAVFLKIWAQRESWNPPGRVKHYLFNAVRNEALNTKRRQSVENSARETIRQIVTDLNQQPDLDDRLRREDLRKAIQAAIEKLPNRCREIFLLNRRSGLTYTEIADTLDISINTVNTQMGRALKNLQKHLSGFISLLPLICLSRYILF